MPIATGGKFILVRHGETEANRQRCFAASDDIELTDLGRSQSYELAARIAAQYRPAAVMSSPFVRARQTAGIIADAFGLQHEILPGIQERNFGCLKGSPYEHMGELMSQDAAYASQSAWTWAPGGGESLEDVRRRVIAALEPVGARFPDREVVIVCHGAVIQAACAHVTNVWTENFVPSNCGMVVIGYDSSGWAAPVPAGEWISLEAGLSRDL